MKTGRKVFILTTFLFFLTATILFVPPDLALAQEAITLNEPSEGCFSSQSFVNLSWTSTVLGSPTFFILRKVEGAGTFTEIGSTNNTFFTDNTPDSDKNYVYQIRAQTAQTFFSNQQTSQAAYCGPVLLTPNTLCAADGPKVNLSWNNVSGSLQTYEIYRNGVKIGQTQNANFSDGPDIEATKSYNYFVKAIWQNGTNRSSDTAQVTAPACAPTLNVAASCLTESPGGPKIDLSWNSLLGVQSYQIYRKAQSESEFSLLANLAGTSFSDNLAESLSGYWQGGKADYYVKAIWETTEKDSAVKQATIPNCQPFLETESNCAEFSFRLSWTTTPGASHYNIYRDGSFLAQKTGASSNSHPDFLDLSICPGQVCSFNYRVEAEVAGLPALPSNSVQSSIDCAAPLPPSPPPVLAPLELYCTPYGPTINISWTPSDNVTYYSVFRDNREITKLRETSYEDIGLESGRNYTYYVEAFGQEGDNTRSENIQSATAVNCQPPSQSTLILSFACQPGNPHIDLSWVQSSNTVSYEIWRGTSAANLAPLIIFDQSTPQFNSRSWRDTNVLPSTTYYYKVVSNGYPGTASAHSGIKSITAPSCLPTLPIVTLNKSCVSGFPEVNVSWNSDHNNTDRYEIFREDAGLIKTIFPPATSWQDTSLAQETTYKYKVEAVSFAGRSAQPYQSITTDYCLPPGPFALNTPPNLYCQASYPRADISWQASSRATSYDLLRTDAITGENLIFSNVSSPYADFGFGNALVFDGADDYLKIPDSDSLDLVRYTAAVWIKYTDTSEDWLTIFSKGPYSGTYENYAVFINRPGQYVHHVLTTSSGRKYFDTPIGSITPGKWFHIAITYNGTIARTYINGIERASLNTSGILVTNDKELRVGSREEVGFHFNGIIDEFYIYNRALSPAEISQLYSGTYNNRSGLAGLWHFDEGSGQAVSDSSNQDNNASLGSGPSAEASDPSWISNGLQAQRQYSWLARAYSSGGNTDSSNAINGTTLMCQPAKAGLAVRYACQPGIGLPAATLNWSYSINTQTYEIYRQDKGLIGTASQSINSASRTFVDNNAGTGLAEETNYTYYIKAVGPTGLTNQSDSISKVTLSCIAPEPPQNLTAAFSCLGPDPQIDLSWNPSNNADYYTVYRDPLGPGFPAQTTATSYTDTTVNVNTQYTYSVRAFGPGGESPISNPKTIITDYCTPSTPVIKSLTTECQSSSPVNNIYWSDATTFNASHYAIYRNTSNSPPPEPLTTSTQLYFNDNLSLSPSTTYYYWIRAIGPTNLGSSLSDSKSFATLSCGITPSTPSLSLQAGPFCKNNYPQAAFSWTQGTPSYSHNLYRTNPDNTTSVYSTRLSPLTDRGDFALEFDASDDAVSADINGVNLAAGTISLWYKPNYNTYDAGNPSHWLFTIGPNSYTSGRIQIHNNATYQAMRISHYSAPGDLLSYTHLTAGNWYNIVYTWDSAIGLQRYYLNGTLNTSRTEAWTPDNTPNSIIIGNRGEEDAGANGFIDEVMIYNRALSANEIGKIYQGIYESEFGLVGAWHFDDGEGSISLDSSGQENHGTLLNIDVGFAWTEPKNKPGYVPPLQPGSNYTYRARAFGADTASNFSNEISFSTALSCAPQKPNLTITPQCEGLDSQLKLSWQPDSNTEYWTISGRREGGTFDEHLDKIKTTQTSYPDTNVETGATYEYYITAFGRGVSENSDLVSATAVFCQDAPYGGQPYSITTLDPSCYGYSSRIQIGWPQDPTGKTISYNLLRKNITAGELFFYKITSGLAANVLSYVDLVDRNNVYQYQVEAVGSGENNTLLSNISPEVEGLDCDSLPPNPPTLYLEGIISTGDLRAVFLRWTDAGNEESYEIWREGSPGELLVTLPGNEIPVDVNWTDSSRDRTLNDGQTYNYSVRAVNRNGSTDSNTIIANIPIAVPGSFTLSATRQEGGVIYLTWTEALSTPAGGTVSYSIWRDNSEDFSSPALVCNNISEAPFECLDEDPPVQERLYRATATNNGGSTNSNIAGIGLPLPIWREIAPIF